MDTKGYEGNFSFRLFSDSPEGAAGRLAILYAILAAANIVTRKLMQEGKRPAAVGFFFSLGHSTVVWLGTIAIALATAAFKDKIDAFKTIGGVAGTLVSASFLFVIAIMNIFILAAVYKTFRHVKAGGTLRRRGSEMLLSGGGFIARMFRPLFRAISKSWHMYPLGFLFRIRVRHSDQIGLLGLSAAGASQGMSLWSILGFRRCSPPVCPPSIPPMVCSC